MLNIKSCRRVPAVPTLSAALILAVAGATALAQDPAVPPEAAARPVADKEFLGQCLAEIRHGRPLTGARRERLGTIAGGESRPFRSVALGLLREDRVLRGAPAELDTDRLATEVRTRALRRVDELLEAEDVPDPRAERNYSVNGLRRRIIDDEKAIEVDGRAVAGLYVEWDYLLARLRDESDRARRAIVKGEAGSKDDVKVELAKIHDQATNPPVYDLKARQENDLADYLLPSEGRAVTKTPAAKPKDDQDSAARIAQERQRLKAHDILAGRLPARLRTLDAPPGELRSELDRAEGLSGSVLLDCKERYEAAIRALKKAAEAAGSEAGPR